ncbi:unnamed protein product [Phaedon cochleariae]|uniref:RRM domain-containing protein n=1 Tax=Phaedon cochleariae TaxID=80249 RepID=A0A9P0GKE3_PHACE|nr:unnamed protein product [Phaedon cochleariae]
MSSDRRYSGGSLPPSDNPPNSRLFIIAPKALKEEDFRKAFSEFGHLEEVRAVTDRATGENKGVYYIKFSKTSEAARAMESMGGKVLLGTGRAMKIMVASSRDQGSKREENEEEKLQRLFVVVSKNMSDSELYDSFKDFGGIDYAHIIRDRVTKESKGFAYVKFLKFSDAANAFENCDKKFRPVFAEPRKSTKETTSSKPPLMSSPPSYRGEGSYGRASEGGRGRAGDRYERRRSLSPPDRCRDEGYTTLSVIANASVNQDQMWKLFDVVPTMEYCTMRYEGERGSPRPTRAIGEVVYSDPRWAAHAKQKLHGFEYPPGNRLIVRAEQREGGAYGKRPALSVEGGGADLRQIADTIAHASSLIQAAGLSPDLLQKKLGFTTDTKHDEPYCSVELPPSQPMASADADTEARCFIVCQESALSNRVLKDVFCRFGNLIDVYLLSNRNCGYACYASKFSADDAIQTLNGADVMGIRLKVIEAEERPGKRARLDDRSN